MDAVYIYIYIYTFTRPSRGSWATFCWRTFEGTAWSVARVLLSATPVDSSLEAAAAVAAADTVVAAGAFGTGDDDSRRACHRRAFDGGAGVDGVVEVEAV